MDRTRYPPGEMAKVILNDDHHLSPVGILSYKTDKIRQFKMQQLVKPLHYLRRGVAEIR